LIGKTLPQKFQRHTRTILGRIEFNRGLFTLKPIAIQGSSQQQGAYQCSFSRAFLSSIQTDVALFMLA
jgi:hypothetical protein